MSDVDLSALNGDFKQAYQDKIKDLVYYWSQVNPTRKNVQTMRMFSKIRL